MVVISFTRFCIGALLAYAVSATTKYELLDYEPQADSAAMVVNGNARFTVLTNQLVRMEWSNSSSGFEDRPTLAFLNRKLDVPKFSHEIANGILTIKTDLIAVSYTIGKPFSSTTLTATGKFGFWSFGAADPGNLLGTIKVNCCLVFPSSAFTVQLTSGWVGHYITVT